MISPAVTQSQMVEKLAEAGRAITRGPHGKALLLEIRLGGHLAALKYNSYLNANAKQSHCHFAFGLVLVCQLLGFGSGKSCGASLERELNPYKSFRLRHCCEVCAKG